MKEIGPGEGSLGFTIDHSFYRPQQLLRKVMFLEVSVCPRGGVYTPWADTPSRQTLPPGRHPPPWADTPHPVGRHPTLVDTPVPEMATAAEGTHPT